MFLRYAAVTSLGVCLVACGGDQKTLRDTERSFVETGQEIAKRHCAMCHNVERTGSSARSDAPPLRTVFVHYNPEALADEFREHIHVGHPDMPDFNFNVKETEAIISYISSIQEVSNPE